VTSRKTPGGRAGERGKPRIGDDWNAITIIALSQSNPRKAPSWRRTRSMRTRVPEDIALRAEQHL